MRIVTVAPLRAVRQLIVFDGSRAAEAELGVIECRVDKRDGGPDPTPWGDVVRQDTWEVNGQALQLGAMFQRQIISQKDGTETYGSWEYVGQADQVGDKYVPVNIDRDRLAAPGQPMRRPEGSELIRTAPATGKSVDAPPRPAVGEQDRDPLTGELMVDENNAPVLVTE